MQKIAQCHISKSNLQKIGVTIKLKKIAHRNKNKMRLLTLYLNNKIFVSIVKRYTLNLFLNLINYTSSSKSLCFRLEMYFQMNEMNEFHIQSRFLESKV